jgi:gluconate kinase
MPSATADRAWKKRRSRLRFLFSRHSGTTGSLSRDVEIKLLRLYQRDRWRISPRRLGSRVDRIPLDRPIFVLGVAGCGGTLVARSLRRNPVAVSMSGDAAHWTGTDEMGIVRNRMQRLPRVLWGNMYRDDIADEVQGTSQLFGSDALLHHYRRTAADATPEDARRFVRLLREHIAVYARDPHNARFVGKTHAHTVRIPLLAALLAGHAPHFVLVVRNPYGTCPWQIRKKPPSFRVELPYERRLELAAEHWENVYRIALEDAGRIPNVTVVRFEDWLADPATWTRSICSEVELEFDEAMVPSAGDTYPFDTLPSDHKWYPLYPDTRLDTVTATESEIVERRCGARAATLGYEPPV